MKQEKEILLKSELMLMANAASILSATFNKGDIIN
jgi:hypothetical protein